MMKQTMPAAPAVGRPMIQTELVLLGIESTMKGDATILKVPCVEIPMDLPTILADKCGLDDRGIDEVMRLIETESAMGFLRSRISRRG